MGVCAGLELTIPKQGCKVGGGRTEAEQIFLHHCEGRAAKSSFHSSVVLETVHAVSSVRVSCMPDIGKNPGMTSWQMSLIRVMPAATQSVNIRGLSAVIIAGFKNRGSLKISVTDSGDSVHMWRSLCRCQAGDVSIDTLQ